MVAVVIPGDVEVVVSATAGSVTRRANKAALRELLATSWLSMLQLLLVPSVMSTKDSVATNETTPSNQAGNAFGGKASAKKTRAGE
jgi:hypothetical protein